MMEKGTRVYNREGTEFGLATGGAARSRRCTMEGCLGVRYGVRWPDGELTYPCSKGLIDRDDGSFQLG